ncbi:MGMT family protein [Paraferrimonas sp. SM1919]|uniref:MGMT family protein n=1 Tax=Paraferrimonas sp. SM1919 TaxID=2662263 RepID=UPI0013D018F1|nr:MGMT family protein [Paraferrimonas sp. SM1919]
MEIKAVIIQTLAAIPSGKVAAYGQIAKMAGYPGYARYVGTVLKQLPSGSNIPWDRVVNAKGEISFAESSKEYLKQHQLLMSEGVVVNNGRVSMKIFGI